MVEPEPGRADDESARPDDEPDERAAAMHRHPAGRALLVAEIEQYLRDAIPEQRKSEDDERDDDPDAIP